MKPSRTIPLDLVRITIAYAPHTGIFTRNGEITGSINKRGYVTVFVDGINVYGHRLAWALMTGVWPLLAIDHKNRIKSDNRWENLRLATHRQNMANREVSSRNKLGFKGVKKLSRGKNRYAARILKSGKETHLGVFMTPEEAHQAYLDAARIEFGEFAYE